MIGGVAEWLKAPVSKTGIRETVSEVRILSPPQMKIALKIKSNFHFWKKS